MKRGTPIMMARFEKYSKEKMSLHSQKSEKGPQSRQLGGPARRKETQRKGNLLRRRKKRKRKRTNGKVLPLDQKGGITVTLPGVPRPRDPEKKEKKKGRKQPPCCQKPAAASTGVAITEERARSRTSRTEEKRESQGNFLPRFPQKKKLISPQATKRVKGGRGGGNFSYKPGKKS